MEFYCRHFKKFSDYETCWRSGIPVPARTKSVLFAATASRPSLGHKRPIRCLSEFLATEVKGSGPKTVRCPLSRSEVRLECSYTSSFPLHIHGVKLN
jgi:hypothetical protein